MPEQFPPISRTDIFNEYLITVGVTPLPVLPSNPARRAVIFSNDSSNRVTIGADPNLPTGKGLTLNGNVQPFQVLRCEFAPWICGPLYAIASAAATNLGIIEIVDQHY